jgi:murein DD-endopeptidase MepM/ murein hydrolase activator NlpD
VLDWNRYAYGRYNPLKYTDPSGNFCVCTADPDSNGYWGKEPISSRPFSFTRLPVSENQLVGVQWFGASQNTHSLYDNGNNIYNYCQGLHCGLDLLAPYGTPVYAGVYGFVEDVWIPGKTSSYEGPYKVQVRVGDYIITYGHTDGTTSLNKGDPVFPWTRLGGVGNMGGNPQSNEVDHIHLEIRGPGGWSGDSQNPYHFFNSRDQVLLIKVSRAQEIWVGNDFRENYEEE